MERIIAIRYFKAEGEFVVTMRDSVTGRTRKTFANHLRGSEVEWLKGSKYRFEGATCICWAD